MRPEGEQQSESIHAWLIWMKASRAVREFALIHIHEAGLGESDFRVLEVLLHQGAMPVNVIGPKVNLNPGSVSVAVDRLHKKKLVNRNEDCLDRRVRNVSLTNSGKRLIQRVFEEHSNILQQVFSVLPASERTALEAAMRKIGMHAQQLAEQSSSTGHKKRA